MTRVVDGGIFCCLLDAFAAPFAAIGILVLLYDDTTMCSTVRQTMTRQVVADSGLTIGMLLHGGNTDSCAL